MRGTMKTKNTKSVLAILAGSIFLLISLFSGCTNNSSTTPTQTSAVLSQTPVAPESNPAGDIPDSQVFIGYHSVTGGYQLEVPEGWARSEQGTNVSFIDKLDGVKVTITQVASAPAIDSVRTSEVASLLKSGRAVQVGSIQAVGLSAGQAIRIEYSSNSDPDPVTGKQVRLDNQMYLFFQNGRQASLILWAPLGADNVDQWQRMAQSFRWY